jgi:hypothetical protein
VRSTRTPATSPLTNLSNPRHNRCTMKRPATPLVRTTTVKSTPVRGVVCTFGCVVRVPVRCVRCVCVWVCGCGCVLVYVIVLFSPLLVLFHRPLVQLPTPQIHTHTHSLALQVHRVPAVACRKSQPVLQTVMRAPPPPRPPPPHRWRTFTVAPARAQHTVATEQVEGAEEDVWAALQRIVPHPYPVHTHKQLIVPRLSPPQLIVPRPSPPQIIVPRPSPPQIIVPRPSPPQTSVTPRLPVWQPRVPRLVHRPMWRPLQPPPPSPVPQCIRIQTRP